MTLIGTHGTYRRASETRGPVSVFDMRLIRLDLVAHWRRCGITADFVADFVSGNFGNPEVATLVLSTVINELIENAVKFSHPDERYLELSAPCFENRLVVETRHRCERAQAERLVEWVERLAHEDPEDLFLEQVEYTFENERLSSGLGLITLVKDYQADVGVRVEADDEAPEVVHLALQVVLDHQFVDES